MWNLYSEEVKEERSVVRAYGLANAERWPRCKSYKSQAKRELAHRLELQCEIDSMQYRLDACIDLLDGLDSGELIDKFAELLPHLSSCEVERLIRVACGNLE